VRNRRAEDAGGVLQRASWDEAIALIVAELTRIKQTSGADAIAGDNAQRLRRWLAELPATHREVVTLAFYGELSHTEIAAHLRLPVATIRGRMRVALKALRNFT